MYIETLRQRKNRENEPNDSKKTGNKKRKEIIQIITGSSSQKVKKEIFLNFKYIHKTINLSSPRGQRTAPGKVIHTTILWYGLGTAETLQYFELRSDFLFRLIIFSIYLSIPCPVFFNFLFMQNI